MFLPSSCILRDMQHTKYAPKDFAWVNWTTKDIEKAAQESLAFQKKTHESIKSVPKEKRTFENTFYPLDQAAAYIGDRMQPIDVLKNGSTKKTIRKKAQEVEVWLSGEMTELIRDKKLYQALKEYNQKSEKLRDEEKLFVKDTLRGFKKMGLDLPEEQQKELITLSKENATLSAQFSENLAEHEDHIDVTKKDLEGFPEQYVQGLKKNKDGTYRITLDYPISGPFLKHCKKESLRKKLTQKIHRRGGQQNIVILEKLASNRLKKAQILGYETHAEGVLTERMAKKPETVIAFLENLHKDIKPAARKDVQLLQKRKQQDFTKKVTFESWDVSYYANQLLKETYDLDTEALREYFPLDYVLNVMFGHFGSLFGVQFLETNIPPKWHKDVRWFEVKKGTKTIGYIALDFFPRPGKFTHMAAWPIIDGRSTKLRGATYTTPVSAMIGNFAKPVGKQQSLLSLGEVNTLYHEFGHLLHNTLTTASLTSQSGFSVTWDFVELPSQLNEQWLAEKSFLEKIGKHYKTGDPLPNETIEKIIATEHFLRPFGEARQYSLAMFDMTLHNCTEPPKNIVDAYKKITKHATGMEPPKTTLYPAGFGHVAGGYDAGYYSYKWAEVYAHDVFSRFKKEGIFSKKVGKAYLNEILSVGSSRPEMESLKAFLGRRPNNKAFLKALGIKS